MGDFHPEAHVKGSFGLRTTALICSKYCATCRPISISDRMAQKYEIFYGEKAFVISEGQEWDFSEFIVFPIKTEEFEAIGPYFTLLEENPDKKGIVFSSEKPGEMLNRFCKEFEEIKAGGGLVVNPKGELLVIKRNGVWDLPKGKIEQGEFLRQGAVREVKEECGIEKVKIHATVKPTFHIYMMDNKPILKTTYWYLMECLDPENIKGQADEGITEIRWVARRELKELMSNSYPNIRFLVDIFTKS